MGGGLWLAAVGMASAGSAEGRWNWPTEAVLGELGVIVRAAIKQTPLDIVFSILSKMGVPLAERNSVWHRRDEVC